MTMREVDEKHCFMVAMSNIHPWHHKLMEKCPDPSISLKYVVPMNFCIFYLILFIIMIFLYYFDQLYISDNYNNNSIGKKF